MKDNQLMKTKINLKQIIEKQDTGVTKTLFESPKNRAMKNVQLPLTRKWFEMTESGVKTEDYRAITNYWADRLLLVKFRGSEGEKMTDSELYSVITHNLDILQLHINGFKGFNNNIMTLGSPKKTDLSKILTLEHKGVEIRGGNSEWGAIPGVKYFVIKHGKIL